MDGNLVVDTTQWVKGKDFPEWMDEVGVATISKGYLLLDETPRKAYRRVAKAIAERLESLLDSIESNMDSKLRGIRDKVFS